jgi:hypothetical protein
MLSSAIGLCLAAPAFAQTTSGQDPLNTPRATPPSSTQTPSAQAPANQAAPARSSQPQSANTGQQQPSQSGQVQNQQQAPAQSGQAQNQQQRPATSGQTQSQQSPAQSGQTQSQQSPAQGGQAQNQQSPARDGQAQNQQQQPASSDQSRASSNQNQTDRPNDRNRAQDQRDRAQNQQQPAASGGSSNSAQAPADRQRSATPNRNPQSAQPDRQQSQSRQPQRDQRRDAQNSRARDNDAARASVKVKIDDRQRTRIASVISTANVRPIDLNFRVETGVVIPATVTLQPLPPTIVQIVPQYRGYRYFVTHEQIVIVEPKKKIIVDVVPLGGTARAQAPAAKKVTFTDQQRDIIRRQTSSARAPATTGSSPARIVVEQEVPEAVELQEFSPEIVTEVPVVRTYRYFRQDDDVVVVDPTERRVIEIIR